MEYSCFKYSYHFFSVKKYWFIWDRKEQTSTCLYITASVTQIYYFKYFSDLCTCILDQLTLFNTQTGFFFLIYLLHLTEKLTLFCSLNTHALKILFYSCYNRSEHFWQLSHYSILAMRSYIQQRLSCPKIMLTHIMPYVDPKASVLFFNCPRIPSWHH